jgi:hypothetical protein
MSWDQYVSNSYIIPLFGQIVDYWDLSTCLASCAVGFLCLVHSLWLHGRAVNIVRLASDLCSLGVAGYAIPYLICYFSTCSLTDQGTIGTFDVLTFSSPCITVRHSNSICFSFGSTVSQLLPTILSRVGCFTSSCMLPTCIVPTNVMPSSNACSNRVYYLLILRLRQLPSHHPPKKPIRYMFLLLGPGV